MLTYEEARERFATARDPYRGKPLENNTRLVRAHGDAYAVALHRTDVVTILPRDRYVLRTGGWQTVTTKDRITKYSPARVFSERGTWYLNTAPTAADPRPVYPGWPSYVTSDAPDRAEYDAAVAAWAAWRKADAAWSKRNRIAFVDGVVVNRNGYPLRAHEAAGRRAAREDAARKREHSDLAPDAKAIVGVSGYRDGDDLMPCWPWTRGS